MPTFPRVNSQAQVSPNIDTRPQEVMRQGAGAEADIINKAAGQMTDITMKWAAAVDSMQETAIKANIATGIAQINQEALNDPEINNEKLRIEQIKKLRVSAMGKGLQNKSLEQQLGIQLDGQMAVAELEINNIYAKKKILADGLNTQSLLENYAGIRSQALQMGNDAAVIEADKAAFSLIQKKVATQLMSEAQGKEAWKNYRLGSVDFDIQADPSTLQKSSPVLQELLKGKQGRYSFLTNDELSDKIKASKVNIWHNKNNQDEAIQQNKTAIAIDLSQRLANGTLSLSDVQKIGADDPKTAAIFDNAIDVEQRDIEDPENKTADYLLKLLDNEKATALDILNKAAEYRGTKNFDDSVYAWVVQEVAKKADREKKGLSGWDKTTQAFKNGAKAIVDFASALTTAGIANKMIGSFTEKVKAGIDPEIAQQEVLASEVKKAIPDIVTYPKEGKIRLDKKSGRQFKVFPDGSWEWVGESNNE